MPTQQTTNNIANGTSRIELDVGSDVNRNAIEAVPPEGLVARPTKPLDPVAVKWTSAEGPDNSAGVNRPSQLADAVAAAKDHPFGAKIADVAVELAAKIADARARHAPSADIDLAAERVGLTREQAGSDFGNVFAILERGAEDPAERAIVAAFVAYGVVRQLEKDVSGAKRAVERLCVLATHAGIDPLSAVPDSAGTVVLRALFRALADHARAIDVGKVPNATRGELLVATAALAEAANLDPEIAQAASRLAADLTDPIGVKLLTAEAADAPSTMVQSSPVSSILSGQFAPIPRGAWLTVFQAITGWLVLRSLFIIVGTYVLGLKREARLVLTDGGLEVKGKIVLLGRQLGDRDALYPMTGISSITRDVRFPRLPVYAGITALLFGTYTGVSLISWGVQAASPRLLAYGLLILLTGVALDLVLTTLLPGLRKKCRVTLVPRNGRTICVDDLDIPTADRLLADLSRRGDR